jgi:hypothetical protein
MTREHKKPSAWRRIVSLVGLALLAAAVVTELRKPRSERTWHGELGGVVPYDLRPPTPARIKASLWSPDDPRLFLPRSAGVGWSPNLGRLARLLTRSGE